MNRRMQAPLLVAHTQHCFVSLHTGTFCSYAPERPTDWQVI
jgi:hypothetical protein